LAPLDSTIAAPKAVGVGTITVTAVVVREQDVAKSIASMATAATIAALRLAGQPKATVPTKPSA
jgi:alpha-D-ribose 1-methylphosphonate 5-phosphate C-P lyase